MAFDSVFQVERIEAGGIDFLCRSGGSGFPVLLLHGYPQSGRMWSRVAPELAAMARIVVPDLPGYGRSGFPADDTVEAFSKRAVGEALVELMRTLGHERFAVIGHDRGGRVAYRMALDHPERIERLGVLDIVPTLEMWSRMRAENAMNEYHWLFLAQPEPLPEMLIAGAPMNYLHHTLAHWTASKDLSAFAPADLAEYEQAYADPARIHAMCQDYRAGWTVDRTLDEQDLGAGVRIACPTLALWGATGFASASTTTPGDVWARHATDLSARSVPSGHFVCEEAPAATAAALLEFLEPPRG